MALKNINLAQTDIKSAMEHTGSAFGDGAHRLRCEERSNLTRGVIDVASMERTGFAFGKPCDSTSASVSPCVSSVTASPCVSKTPKATLSRDAIEQTDTSERVIIDETDVTSDVPITAFNTEHLNLGDVKLTAGRHRLEAEASLSEQTAFDCWLLTKGDFTPNGVNLPDQNEQKHPVSIHS